jgi:2,3-bisphosphoglycerate-dependent phosphoglycerate mutase
VSAVFVLRHAPSKYSAAYRVNGDPAVDVALTAEGEAACRAARAGLPLGSVVTCVSSAFARCHRTAELLIAGETPVLVDARLNELDYGAFEGGEFVAYARWLAQHGPRRRPPEAAESQAEGIARMLSGLKTVLDRPGPRLVVAHGLLVSVLEWAREHPSESLTEALLPVAPCLRPLVLPEAELSSLSQRLLHDLEQTSRRACGWHVDLGVFPKELRTVLLPSV